MPWHFLLNLVKFFFWVHEFFELMNNFMNLVKKNCITKLSLESMNIFISLNMFFSTWTFSKVGNIPLNYVNNFKYKYNIFESMNLFFEHMNNFLNLVNNFFVSRTCFWIREHFSILWTCFFSPWTILMNLGKHLMKPHETLFQTTSTIFKYRKKIIWIHETCF